MKEFGSWYAVEVDPVLRGVFIEEVMQMVRRNMIAALDGEAVSRVPVAFMPTLRDAQEAKRTIVRRLSDKGATFGAGGDAR